jgi:hypothetical protein
MWATLTLENVYFAVRERIALSRVRAFSGSFCVMKDRHDYYRKQAAAAQGQARAASRDEDKAAWLKLAEDWLSLVLKAPGVADQQRFDHQAEAEGTHQNVPDTQQ